MKKMKGLVMEHGDAVDGVGWRLSGVEVQRLPLRREASSDPRFELRSSGGAPSARPARRRRHRLRKDLVIILFLLGLFL